MPSLPLLGFFLCLSFFFGLFVTRTGGPIMTIYKLTSYDVFPPRDVPFRGFVDIASHLGGANLQKPILGCE